MQDVSLIVHSARQLLTMAGGPQRGADLGRLGMIEGGALAVDGGRISAVGPTAEIRSQFRAGQEVDASDSVILPGFVDAHTHVVWAGDRSAEFEMRIEGASYMEIMEAGGGILSTVRQTREASAGELAEASLPRVKRMLAHGTTTAEAKTGYGLETGAELRMLEAILAMDSRGPMELAPTFLGAHAVPAEYSGRSQEYVDLICGEMLPAVLAWWRHEARGRPLPFVDVFCERGAFDLNQSRQILDQARKLGFPLKMHVDEFESLGGTELAISRGAVSADHLVCTPPEAIQSLGVSDTVAVSLPCTPFGLAEPHYTPAKSILAAGGTLAIASDLNPGTAWCENMQFVIALACRYLDLTPAQAIAAATINAAAAIRRQDRVGSLETGKQADMILLEIPDYRHVGYRFGTNLASTVIKRGRIVSRNGEHRWVS
jgi:imidazolonepropionase